jgi:hypothetical protein
MEDIEKRAGSEAIKNFLNSLRTENTLKEDFLKIVPQVLALGGTVKDIEAIFNNPTLMESFVDKSATAEQIMERIKKYLDAVRSGEAIDLKFTLMFNPDEAKNELKKKAEELFGFLERAAQREYKPKIINAEKEVKSAQDAVDAVQKEIQGIQDAIEKEQRSIEKEITRPIEDFQEEISDLQRVIELEFERPLAALSDESSMLSEELTVMDKVAEGINKKYDAQAEALTKISDINQEIIGQQKQQIGLADALTQGDISAAANAAQEMRASQAESAAKSAGDIIEAGRQAEISALRSPVSGLTRLQIEQRQFEIERQTFALNQQRKSIDEAILVIQDKIYNLEEEREKRLIGIRKEEDRIYEITNNQLKTAQSNLETAQRNLDKLREELQARLDAIDLQRDAWEAAADAEIAAAIAAGDYNDVILKTIEYLNNVLSLWQQIAAAAAAANAKTVVATTSTTTPVVQTTPTALTPLQENTKKINEQISTLTELRKTTSAGSIASFKLKEQIDELNDNLKNPKTPQLIVDEQSKFRAMNNIAAATTTSLPSVGGGGAFSVQYMSKGGMVPKYMAGGGLAKGTDTVPAMLTPGEFVMNKNATKKFGPLLSSLNRGQYPGAMSQGKFGISSNSQSFISPSYSVVSPTTISSPSTNVAAPSYNNNSNTVYNYSVGINVGGSNVNPDSIAKAVLGEIKYIDSQRIRGQR